MSLYVADAIGDAWSATRSFLTPFEWRRWLKLSVVVFFLGGPAASLGNFNGLNADIPSDPGGPPGPSPDPVFPALGPGSAELLTLVAVVVVVVLLVVLVFGAIGAIMEFVFVESLMREEVTIRRYWGRHWGRGLRLFGFRLAVGAVSLLALGLAVAAFVLPFLTGVPGVGLAGLLVLLPVVAVLTVVSGLINGFTRVFVVPIMIQRECGVLAGWRRLWGTIREQWKEFGAYAVAGFVLGIAGGILAGITVGVLGVIVGIPFLVVGAIGAALLGVESLLGIAVLVAVGLVFVAVLLGLFAVVQVPIMTYLRYVALFVLGDAVPELDPIPGQRSSIRADGDEDVGAAT